MRNTTAMPSDQANGGALNDQEIFVHNGNGDVVVGQDGRPRTGRFTKTLSAQDHSLQRHQNSSPYQQRKTTSNWSKTQFDALGLHMQPSSKQQARDSLQSHQRLSHQLGHSSQDDGAEADGAAPALRTIGDDAG